MKHTWVIGIGFLLLFFNASLVLANGIPDPRIQVGGDFAAGVQYEYYPAFPFYSSPSGDGTTPFINKSGYDWTSLSIEMPMLYYQDSHGDWKPCLQDDSCFISVYGGDLFAFHSVTIDEQEEEVTILFWGVGEQYVGEGQSFFYGIPFDPDGPYPIGSHWYVDYAGIVGSGGQGGLQLNGTATEGSLPHLFPVPEPATFVLLLGGFAVLVLCSCWRKRELAP